MKKIYFIFSVVLLLGSFIDIVPAFAIPSLQLDIKNGVYDKKSETIVAAGNNFTLYAYLIPDIKAQLEDKYYISAAITPQVETLSDLGSFTFAGTEYDVTGELIPGNPPVEILPSGQNHDAGDLPPHGIFPTYFMEYSFKFDDGHRSNPYNAQLSPGLGPSPDDNGGMYFHAFEIDTSSIKYPYVVHFDLYNTEKLSVTEEETNKVCKWKNGKFVCRNVVNEVVVGYDIEIKANAPFSHDAESRKVPEPPTVFLLGAGLLALGIWGRTKLS